MKRASIIFLQVVIVLIGIGILFALLREPHTEGVNVGKGFFEVYLDPFIWLIYAGSIPFFTALYQTIKVLGYVRKNSIFSEAAVRALGIIKYCALTIIGFVIVEEIIIMLNHGNDDAAGAVSLGIIITLGSVIVATVAAMFGRILQNGVDMKSENDLTV